MLRWSQDNEECLQSYKEEPMRERRWSRLREPSPWDKVPSSNPVTFSLSYSSLECAFLLAVWLSQAPSREPMINVKEECCLINPYQAMCWLSRVLTARWRPYSPQTSRMRRRALRTKACPHKRQILDWYFTVTEEVNTQAGAFRKC